MARPAPIHPPEWDEGEPVTPDHATVLAAIDKARAPSVPDDYEGLAFEWARGRNAHCDDLLATALHHSVNTNSADDETCGGCANVMPCPDYQQVIDRLTSWGALP